MSCGSEGMNRDMFRKLRNRLLLFNLAVTGIVILAAFGTVYWSTFSNIQSDIRTRLYAVPDIVFFGDGTTVSVGQVGDSGTLPSGGQIVITASEMFTLETDSAGEVLAIHSVLNMPDAAYAQAARMALSDKNGSTPIDWQGKKWRSKISPVQDNADLPVQEAASSLQRLRITFLDVTDSYAALSALRNTLLAVGAAVLLLLFAISFLFANRAIRPVIEAWTRQKQFVSDASHELKTPLSIVNANLAVLLENRKETVESQMKWLEYIRIGTDRMTKLIYDLLTLARIDDSSRQPDCQTFDLGRTVADVLSTFEAAIVRKNIALTQSGFPRVIVKENEERIRQVLTILTDNAVKYANEGGKIHISLIKTKTQAQFEISNTGKGIRQEDLSKVFDRFYRTDSARTYESGSYGLGLAIAKGIIEQAGGSITVQSKGDQWTVFTFKVWLL